MWPRSTKTIITGKNGQRKHQKLVHWSRHYYKYTLNSVVPILLQESNNADLTEIDLFCKVQVSSEKYCRTLWFSKSKVLVVYKRKLKKVNNRAYNMVIPSLLKDNMNFQYVTGIYAMLTYSTSYLCKLEHLKKHITKM